MIRPRMSPLAAPNARRIPSSRVRRLTEKAITPYRPTEARNSAAPPKTMKSVPKTP